ncbi:MAG TPA: methyltransferase [Pseudonocardiaceae bacterium]|nr:methyltransferase [Pseudonocardiaceae bacterium]
MTESLGWGGELWAAADLLTPMAIRVAATLRLADHIAAGTRTTEALATAVHADQDALGRLLRHLVVARVLSRVDTDTYELADLGQRLREDHPDGIRRWLDLDGAIGRADQCFVQLLHTVRTGEAAYPRQFGRGFWADLAADPALAASFDDLMGARLVADAPLIASSYPWGSLGHVVDAGGGNGTILIAILNAHPDLRGTVLDLPGPIVRAQAAITEAGLTDRAEAVAVDAFDVLPAGAGGYLLSGVLHDWPDEDATRILGRCADAAGAAGRVLVIEEVIEDVEGGTGDTIGDLTMLTYVRGRNRTLPQLAALAAQVGLGVGTVTPISRRSIIELIPSD